MLRKASGTRTGWAAWSAAQADAAAARYAQRGERLERERREEETRLAARGAARHGEAPAPERRRGIVEAALARARAQRVG